MTTPSGGGSATSFAISSLERVWAGFCYGLGAIACWIMFKKFGWL